MLYSRNAPSILDEALNTTNSEWVRLRNTLKEKEDEFTHGSTIQKFLLDGSETTGWIEEKERISFKQISFIQTEGLLGGPRLLR